MQNIVENVKSLWTYKTKVRIDNLAFTLHKTTAGILLFLSLLISTAFLLKDPIACINDKTVDRVINAYCWIHATYTLPEKLNGNKSATAFGHPGVAPLTDEDDEIKVHKYYQWVCFVLFFQALAFYAPRWLWKNMEEQRLSRLTKGLDDMDINEEARKTRMVEVQEYFYNTMGFNDSYSMKMALCEVLNFVNVVIQIDLTDRFLDRALSTYGLSLIHFDRQDPMYRTDPMAVVFPPVTKCTFNMYGPSGNIIPYDALCILPFNIYNEKFYPFLWLWLIILAVISGLALLYRFTTYLLPELRYELLRRRFHVPDEELDHIHELNRKLDYGDWYLLYQFGKNIGPLTFLDFLNGLASRVAGGNNNAAKSIESMSSNKEKYL